MVIILSVCALPSRLRSLKFSSKGKRRFARGERMRRKGERLKGLKEGDRRVRARVPRRENRNLRESRSPRTWKREDPSLGERMRRILRTQLQKKSL